ncbi:disintegrin and metalloproteinase domain-containing protein 8 isoform X2 [Rhinatrema bivittatum]|uniref:disintegrin and metalloproteinase domain-containing protein 8 isoform X2 n=1 Tax=Rhinatrema bivittatum TaxID=194408 RepID=UPI00112AAE62|nr:disintegrin and metalloproteinase domain-containing protein 8 isoform X2 [Rhinatrema bivittatum]
MLWLFLFIYLWNCLGGLECSTSQSSQLAHVEKYESVIPQRLKASPVKRDLYSKQNSYPENVQYAINVEEHNYILHLERNTGLMGKHYTETHYLENGTEVTERPNVQDHCFYHGHIAGINDSSASISTCKGLSGFFQTDHQVYLIEPLEESRGEEGKHAVYRQEHLKMKRATCGDANHTMYDYGPKMASVLKPFPWKSAPLQKGTRYVELFLVVDNAEYRQYKDIRMLQNRMKEIVNHVDKLYQALNFRVALIGLEIWSHKDKIPVSPNADTTLNNFLAWRKTELLRKKKHDNAQLITGVDFDGTTVGLATKLAMCTGDSGAVNQDHSGSPLGAASTMAHEMGHNLGMSHDEDVVGCSCAVPKANGGCVMAQSVGMVYPKYFSSCSRRDLQSFLSDSRPICLLNMPDVDQLFGGPVCGNQFVEHGEECDCGTLEVCTNPCCNATTCKLREGAECAQGECCHSCKIRASGELCRNQKDECDLPEYCTGKAAECPEDVFQENGFSCQYGKGYCFNGECPSLSQHCQTLWGSGAHVAPDICFQNNMQGTKDLHCKKTEHGYRACSRKDVKCGKLHCVNGNNLPITHKSYVITLNRGQQCKVAEIADDVTGNSPDPGMVPTGTKCGEKTVCFDGLCQSLSIYGASNCSSKCGNHGVCNHKRECHCEPGWAPPYCSKRLTEIAQGGSSVVTIVVVLIVVILLAVLAVGGVVYYKWKHKKYPPKRTTVKDSNSGLSNPLFQEGRNKGNVRTDSQNQKIGFPQLITTTSNLQGSKSAFITIIPNRDSPEPQAIKSNSHHRPPVPTAKPAQVIKPTLSPPIPPCTPFQTRPAYSQVKPNPPTKPLPELKMKQGGRLGSSPAAPVPPAKPTALHSKSNRSLEGVSPKVALKPPTQKR